MYHASRAAPDTLVWRTAVAQAKAGKRFDELLAAAYPGAALGSVGNDGAPYLHLARNEFWLARAVPHWQRVLRGEPGYETPTQPPAVCAVDAGVPYSEQSRNRIFMRVLSTREDRITLAHEFLHLGLRRHPNGNNEAYVEQMARRLIDAPLAVK